MENWKSIKGFTDYEVSDLGRVRSVSHTVWYINKWGEESPVLIVGRVLRPGILKRGTGYKIVSLSKGDKQLTKLVHRLVAEAFIPNPLSLPEVNHKGSTRDCRAHMLEWRSRVGNMQHASKNEKFGKNAGVYLEKRRGHWVARMWSGGRHGHGGHCTYIGSFPTKREALAARRAAVKALPEVL